MTTTRAAIYLRQSQWHEDTISEEIQESGSRALCERAGYEVVGVYRDIDLSGRSLAKRKGLAALRKAWDAGEFDIAVGHSYSRFARNMADGAELVGAMPLHTVLEGKPDDPDDDFVPLLHMLLAHKQSQEIRKRWREVHDLNRAAGKPARGGSRWGYLYTRGEGYSPDPAHSPAVVATYQRYVDGEGVPRLVAWLNEAGHMSTKGNPWDNSTLQRALDSGFAAGVIRDKSGDYAGAHEPLITPELWAAYGRERERRSSKRGKARAPQWYLSGLVVCGLCGGPMTVANVRRQYASVACSRSKTTGKAKCPGIMRVRSQVESAFGKWLLSHGEEAAAAMPDASQKRLEAEAARDAARAAVEAADAALNRVGGLVVKGVISEAVAVAQRAELEAERAEAESAERDALAALHDLLPADAPFYEVLESRGEGMPPEVWNATLRRIVSAVRVLPDGVEVVPVNGPPRHYPKPAYRRANMR